MLSTPARPIPRSVAAGYPVAEGQTLHDGTTWSWLSSRYFTLVLLTLSLPFICLAGRPLFGDAWWVMASGRVLVEQGQIPQADPFTFAPHTSVYFDVQWLGQLAFYTAYRLLGLEGVAVFNAAVASLTFGLILRLAWQRSHNMAAATLSVLFAELTALWFLHPRAQTLAFAAFAATAVLLTAVRPRLRTLVGLGALAALWANLHGSFFIGPVLSLLLLAGEVGEALLQSRWRSLIGQPRVRFLTLAVLAQALGTLVNPYGLGIYSYLLKFSVDPIIRDHISEWLPTTATDFPGAEFFAAVGITIAVLVWARSRVALADLLVVGLFAVLGLQAYRNIPWWGLATSPILATYLARWSMPRQLARLGLVFIASRRQVRGNLLRAALMSVVLVGSLPWGKAANPWLSAEQRSLISSDYPQAAASFLATHPLGSHVFTDHGWGSYMDWWSWPRYQPMIDPAIEIHPTDAWLDIMRLNAGHATWEEIADRYGVDVLMLRYETQTRLIEAVQRSPRWQPVYEDDQTIIYVRSTDQEARS